MFSEGIKKKKKSLRKYFKKHRKLNFVIDMAMAVTLISFGVLLIGSAPGFFVGLIAYFPISILWNRFVNE
ncbi:hypothetical protein AAGG74_15555 [Bacillus mexicanus]|uniref:hypothetical protein n=1 Tax=Bacillus mexicanus TaxID=2834415 RepID=UPI003D24728A